MVKKFPIILDYPNIDRATVAAMDYARMCLQKENNALADASFGAVEGLFDSIRIKHLDTNITITPVGTEVVYTFKAVLFDGQTDDDTEF